MMQIISAFVSMSSVLIPKYIIEELVEEKRLEIIVGLSFLMALLNLLGGAINNFFDGKSMLAKHSISIQFRSDMVKKLATCDFQQLESSSFLDAKEKAERFLTGNGRGFASVIDSFFTIIGTIIILVGMAAILSTLNTMVLIIYTLLLILNGLYTAKIKQNFVKWDLERAPLERRTRYLFSIMSDFSFGKELRIFGFGNWIIEKIKKHLNKVHQYYIKQVSFIQKSQYISRITTFFLNFFSYVYVAVRVVNESISIGDFSMYTSALSRFSGTVNLLLQNIIQIKQFDGYYNALKLYTKLPQTMRIGANQDIPSAPYELKFENVSFIYPGQETYALRDINIKLKTGEKISIVGENGAGKTTFIKLLCRLYNPTEGRITLNGIDIREISYDHYMSLIASVFQDFKLLSFSIKDNIAFENSKTERDQRIYQILQELGLEYRIKSLKNGIDTNVYKHFSNEGFEPSGGEGQKIAIARAIYKNASIIILDEPTAALDPKSEHEIYKEFSSMVKDKISVFISHRMSSSKFCDYTVVFHEGQICEMGTHEQLMAKKGRYYHLFKAQAQYYINDKEN